MVNELRERLLLWKEWEPPKLIKREISIPETKDIMAIIGPRRAGKTYFMFQIIKNLTEKGIPRENILYINFDDIVFRKYDLKKILEVYFEVFNPKGQVYLFLDEVQNLRDWSIWLRTLYDQGYKIFVTGSSSKLLLKEIASELRGRYISKILLPFSFKEFLRAKNFEFSETSEKRGRLKNLLEEYLKFGGFPEVIFLENKIDKREKLSSIFETTFYRDLVERYRVREIEVARYLLEYLASNVSNFVSITKIHNNLKSLGVHVSKRTLWKYYNFMLESLLIFECKIFTYSKKKEMISPRKIYTPDLGISNLLKEYKIGSLIECAVFLELFRHNIEPKYLLINSREVDFVIKGNKGWKVIEVTYDVDEEHTKKVFEAMRKLKTSEGIIITWDYEDEREIKWFGKRGKIKFIPLWKWLLNK